MGLLVNGQWVDQWYDTEKTKGEFVRQESRFRNWITPDGEFPAEKGRYHLYVSYACPWAHRTLITRAIKCLEDYIPVSVVDPYMGENGWEFGPDGDPLYGSKFAHEIYTRAAPDYTGRVTVPILWDKKTETIVSNESAEIIRMLNSAFNHLTGNELDLCPEELRDEIEEVNMLVYDNVNNGVYKAGFATSQEAYEEAYGNLFAALDKLEERLSNQRYLIGERPTEADIRLFTTLLRFDSVYHGHFKCNKQRLADYPNLWAYTREIYNWAGVKETIYMDHIKDHYYGSHKTINPTGVVPLGPELDFDEPHGRERLPGIPLYECQKAS